MESFKGESIIDFFDTFKTDLDCLEYLASIKWKEGFRCSKCNHSKLELDDKGGVKRAYFKRIDDYSSDELGKIFQGHISPEAKVKTDKWTGYKPLKKAI